MKIGLLVIALGGDYRPYARYMLKSAAKFFPAHTPIVWTDDDFEMPSRSIRIRQNCLDFPQATLYRYRLFTEQTEVLRQFDQLFYCDADMEFVAPVKESDICSSGITATLHPGFTEARLDEKGRPISTGGVPERRHESTACLSPDSKNQYFCGAFNGGDAKSFITMSGKLHHNIHLDMQKNIIAKWHDESHLNHYLFHNPPAKILSPSFCYPEGYKGQWGWKPTDHPPILVAVNKGGKIR